MRSLHGPRPDRDSSRIPPIRGRAKLPCRRNRSSPRSPWCGTADRRDPGRTDRSGDCRDSRHVRSCSRSGRRDRDRACRSSSRCRAARQRACPRRAPPLGVPFPARFPLPFRRRLSRGPRGVCLTSPGQGVAADGGVTMGSSASRSGITPLLSPRWLRREHRARRQAPGSLSRCRLPGVSAFPGAGLRHGGSSALYRER